MKIICIACKEGAPEIEEEEYAQHMKKIHGGKDQISEIQKAKSIKKNVPKTQDLPPGIKPDDLPTDEFMQTIAEIAKEQEKPAEQAPVAPQTPPAPVPEIKPLELTYRWEGNCPTCNTPVNTFMIEVKGTLTAVAFCITHKQLKAVEVQPIEKEKK